ncbi:MAG: (deoxy)nucleoside triphosphate pyrophosphohydrolase [Deltaproteobacteria bacterium]|nr:(deoxy)nucleoside triphosphate pyrophosphohydrolase [Deltaproteobacteria bacterium]
MNPTELPRIRVVAAVIARDGTYLITQRRPNAVLPLLWEFPGGRVETGETDEAALVRELRHRLDVEVEVGERIAFESHAYATYVVELFTYDCRLRAGEPVPRNVHAFAWVKSGAFDDYAFTPPDEASVAKLLGLGRD